MDIWWNLKHDKQTQNKHPKPSK